MIFPRSQLRGGGSQAWGFVWGLEPHRCLEAQGLGDFVGVGGVREGNFLVSLIPGGDGVVDSEDGSGPEVGFQTDLGAEGEAPLGSGVSSFGIFFGLGESEACKEVVVVGKEENGDEGQGGPLGGAFGGGSFVDPVSGSGELIRPSGV